MKGGVYYMAKIPVAEVSGNYDEDSKKLEPLNQVIDLQIVGEQVSITIYVDGGDHFITFLIDKDDFDHGYEKAKSAPEE